MSNKSVSTPIAHRTHSPAPATVDEADIVRMLSAFYAGLFPKVCANCGRRYATLKDYILSTDPLWPSIDYDIEMGNQTRLNPSGGLAMANCVCGSTLALSSKDMPAAKTALVFGWIREEATRRACPPQALLDHLRDQVRKFVLAAPDPPGPAQPVP
jgi:hypothetical protein